MYLALYFSHWLCAPVQVSRILTYPGYRGSDRNLAGDIALLQLQQPAVISPQVVPICVDWARTTPELQEGSVGKVNEYGDISNRNNRQYNYLHEFEHGFTPS